MKLVSPNEKRIASVRTYLLFQLASSSFPEAAERTAVSPIFPLFLPSRNEHQFPRLFQKCGFFNRGPDADGRSDRSRNESGDNPLCSALEKENVRTRTCWQLLSIVWSRASPPAASEIRTQIYGENVRRPASFFLFSRRRRNVAHTHTLCWNAQSNVFNLHLGARINSSSASGAQP